MFVGSLKQVTGRFRGVESARQIDSKPEKTLPSVGEELLSVRPSSPSELKRFCFKWQEGDSEPLIGGSEVFSEVERNS